jgi:hypothetical protein
MARDNWDAIDATFKTRLHTRTLRVALGTQLLAAGFD